MPTYWEESGEAPTKLRVGDAWPASGGAAHAGSPTAPTWSFSPHVSWAWYTADFAKQGGLHTSCLNSCSAIVYLFGPDGGDPTHGTLWHVNCSTYGEQHTPAAALKALDVKGVSLRRVIIGYNYVTQGAELRKDVRGCVRAFHDFLETNGVVEEPWIYCGRSESFGVSRDGFVGLPRRMAADRTSVEPITVSASTGQAEPTGCARCYVTTAICRARGLPDDCDELLLLRSFRDQVMLADPEGRREVADYYATAPALVRRIEAAEQAGAIYESLYAEHLRPAVAAVARGDHATARAAYRSMVMMLRERFGEVSASRPDPGARSG